MGRMARLTRQMEGRELSVRKEPKQEDLVSYYEALAGHLLSPDEEKTNKRQTALEFNIVRLTTLLMRRGIQVDPETQQQVFDLLGFDT